MHYFLVDCWSSLTREIELNGFSAVRAVHPRDLEDLPRCPACELPVWPRRTLFPFAIEFTGRRVGDIAFHLGSTAVVSSRFMSAWSNSNLTGLLFSASPLEAKFLFSDSACRVGAEFFAVDPEPEFCPLSESAGATYEEPPSCETCGTGVVDSLDRVEFLESHRPSTDFFLPSSLPGWFAVSERALGFISDQGFLNFRFVRGFSSRSGSEKTLDYA